PDLSRGRLDEPQDAASRRGLAATRFPNEAERLARREVEAHAIDRMDALHLALEQSPLDGELLHEVADLEKIVGHGGQAVPAAMSSARMQRTLWPRLISRSSGVAARHSSIAWGQRAAKRQPGRGSSRLGTTPGIASSLRVPPSAESIRGIDLINP